MKCEFCGRDNFVAKAGLTSHIKKFHPQEYLLLQKAAKPPPAELENLSMVQIEEVYMRKKRALDDLRSEERQLMGRLEVVRKQIQQLELGQYIKSQQAKVAPPPSNNKAKKWAKMENETPLHELIQRAVKGAAGEISVDQIADSVLEAGYRTVSNRNTLKQSITSIMSRQPAKYRRVVPGLYEWNEEESDSQESQEPKVEEPVAGESNGQHEETAAG